MTRPRAVLFGKLPSHGDFVARNLERDARTAWDDWASTGLAQARHTLGDQFEAVHDEAPPWRFVDGPGRFGLGWRAGAFAPSVDSSGRRFLIVVAIDDLAGPEAARLGEDLAQKMERLIYIGIEQGLDADRLVQAAAGQGQDPAATDDGGPPRTRWWTLGGIRYASQTWDDVVDIRLAMAPPAEMVLGS